MQSDKEISGSLAKSPSKIFYGWWIVATVSALYVIASGTYWSGFSLYFLSLTKDLSLSRTSLSLALGLGRLVGGLQGPVTGYLVDHLGPRLMIVIGGALAGLGFILLAHTHSYLTFLLVYVGLMGIGFSGGFDQGIIAVANQWFIRRKAQAMSFLWVGLALGSAFIVPAVGLMVAKRGWRDTATLSGVALLVLLVPAFFVIRNSPEDMGLRPDGPHTPSWPAAGSGQGSATALRQSSDASQPAMQVSASGLPYAEVNFTARQGFRTGSYWLLALALGVQIAASQGLLAHFTPIIVWKGQTETTAAFLIGIYGLGAIPLYLLMGWAGDRWPKQQVTSCGMMLGGLSLGVLMLSSGQLWQLVVFIVLYTIASSTSVVAWALAGDLFGRKAFATLLGGMTMVYSVLSATTPVIAGWIFDTTGSYWGALLFLAILFAVAGLLFWYIPRPKPVLPVNQTP
jgi:MFS family permease